MLAHLQSTCGGIHALDVLALQEKMHNAHNDSEGIPEYINTLEDGWDKAKTSGSPHLQQHVGNHRHQSNADY